MADVIGYEEKDPAVTQRLRAGYPRFAPHPYVRLLVQKLSEQFGAGLQIWPVINARVAVALIAHLGESARSVSRLGVLAVTHPAEPQLTSRAKHFLQHTGGLLSSRAAEDALVQAGVLPATAPERWFVGDALAEVRRVIAPCFSGVPAEQVHIVPSGMAAMHAAIEAVRAVQAPRRRTAWLQLGWLYLDTIALLKKFTPDPECDYLCQHDVSDMASLQATLSKHGHRLAGIVTEAPTNPLLHTPDLTALARLARQHGIRLIIDPALSSPFNTDVLPYADVVAFSLTKYAAHAGDVLAGAVVVNPQGTDALALSEVLPVWLDPLYPRDLSRLAAQIAQAPEVVRRINANTPQVVEFLRQHPSVSRVWWTGQRSTAGNYAQIAREPKAVGGVVSFTLNGALASFYDRVPLPKGPSFGMSSTLLCPYVYLAHYDLLPGRSDGMELASAGVSPDLVRLSVGTEPAAEIIVALAVGLEA